jgi:hypothetical protein
VETPADPDFVKLTGPETTVARWDASLVTFIRSLRWE